ncbi:MAG TPA: hypothetical protein VKA55_08830 [Gammaproteobacteria bacterium]|nr:hypothetical protein [Gammaproteobacteria bacterium]
MDRRHTGIHIGARGWTFPEDVSGLYPEDLPADWQLELYTTQFHALELPALEAPPDAEEVALWEAETLEDAALALPLSGDWAVRLAAGGDLDPLVRALEPLGDKLAVLLWPQQPPTEAARRWPGVLHLDAGADILSEAAPGTPPGSQGPTYRRLDGPGRHHPDTLDALARHLVQRAERGVESFVFFGDPAYALLDAGALKEAVERALETG